MNIFSRWRCVEATKSSLRGEAKPRRGNLRNFILFSRLPRSLRSLAMTIW
ncbi:hypothetical protein [Rickettsia hoogstraalii]|nr:hypothetical protein [Rickettsia hoogstraalii]